MNLKQQIRTLLALECLGYFRPAGCIWVLLLAQRGFSLAEIGLAEGVFHLVSLMGEVPSGVCADLWGRRRTLAASQIMLGVSALAMLLSQNLGGVLVAMACSALGYNLASGTREAITYDSLRTSGKSDEYLSLSSTQNMVYRLATAVATLCAGLTAQLGFRMGYGIDVILSLLGAALALSLKEPVLDGGTNDPRQIHFFSRLKVHVQETGAFLKQNPRCVRLMIFNALVGALATLLGFYLQDGLRTAGAPTVLLGPLLLLVGLGGVAGSRMSTALGRLPFHSAGLLCIVGVFSGCLMAGTGAYPVMALGGFLTTACDDGFQLLTDARLNNDIPSDRRATLLSVSSLCFSLVMVVLSPLAGLAVS